MVRDLRQLADTRFDLLVIGAGIYGALVAWDAALRGLSVALVDRGDFGGGASSNSLKTLHGGLRSLQSLDVPQMRLFIHERRALARVAPHLVRVLPCVVPTYADLRRGVPLMRAALAINDTVARDRNDDLPDLSLHIPASGILSRAECLRVSPLIDPEGVTGGALWHDYQMRNADRLTLAFVRSAESVGAVCANYLAVSRLLLRDNTVEGASVTDALSETSLDIRARVTINAAGAAAGELIASASSTGRSFSLPRLSRAMNLVTRQLQETYASGGMTDGRFLFLVPWRDVSVVGTSHDALDDQNSPLSLTRAHVEAFLHDAQKAFPRAALTLADIRAVHRGLLPMVSGRGHKVKLLRESLVIDHQRDGIPGLVSVFGVRYTTARRTAGLVADAAFRQLGYPLPPACRTDRIPVSGGDVNNRADLVRDVLASTHGRLDAAGAERFVTSYGAGVAEPLSLLSAPELQLPLSGTCAVTGAEIAYAARVESALRLSDALIRRTEAGSAGHPGQSAVTRAAAIMRSELGWSDDQTSREVGDVEAFYKLPF